MSYSLAENCSFTLGELERDPTVGCYVAQGKRNHGYCNGGLQNWEYDDDPWEGTAKWFLNRQFLLREKGQAFVHQHLSTNPHLARPIIAKQEGSTLPSVNREELRKKEKISKTLENSEICKNVIAMGFSTELVKLVLEDRVNAGTEANADDIYDSTPSLLDDVMKKEREMQMEVDEKSQDEDQSSIESGNAAFPDAAIDCRPRGRWRMANVVSDEHRKFLKNLYLNKEIDRLASFSCWPISRHDVSPASLAKNGFFYLGDHDRTQCFSCGGVLRNWSVDDDAEEEHRTHFPTCAMTQGRENRNVPVPTQPENIVERMVRYPWPYAASPHMSNRDNRVKTFDQRWPGNCTRATTAQIADAGFCFLGERKHVKCWYCNDGLQNWEHEDGPWEEHAKWFPNCQFRLREKGQAFIHQHSGDSTLPSVNGGGTEDSSPDVAMEQPTTLPPQGGDKTVGNPCSFKYEDVTLWTSVTLRNDDEKTLLLTMRLSEGPSLVSLGAPPTPKCSASAEEVGAQACGSATPPAVPHAPDGASQSDDRARTMNDMIGLVKRIYVPMGFPAENVAYVYQRLPRHVVDENTLDNLFIDELLQLNCQRDAEMGLPGHESASYDWSWPVGTSSDQEPMDGVEEYPVCSPQTNETSHDIVGASSDQSDKLKIAELEKRVLELQNNKEERICKVCLVEQHDHALCPCGHVFCRKCIERVLENDDPKCPVCRERICGYVKPREP